MIKEKVATAFKIAVLTLILMPTSTGLLGATAKAELSAPPHQVREVELTYHTDLTGIDPNAHRIEVWIPLPREDSFQRISGISINGPAHAEVIDQPTGGNSIVHFSATSPLAVSIPVTIRCKVRRVEEAPDLLKAQRNLPEPRSGEFVSVLGPDRLVPIDGEISMVSARAGSLNASPYQQARAIYEYVIANMVYDKSGTGWGRGDAIYACNVKRGNCTDFHSLFIAIARSRGIPARFTIGLPLGTAASGAIPGYHCWAEFYSGGEWVPIDASEAWKHPQLRQYYFGHLDADRVAFTMGRDLVLKPRQQAGPLNFMIYPYVELDGQPLPMANIKNSFQYADLPEQDRHP
jgi:transglutaminase-like putative cysteine protease